MNNARHLRRSPDALLSASAFVPWLHITKALEVGFPHHQASLVIPSPPSSHLYPYIALVVFRLVLPRRVQRRVNP